MRALATAAAIGAIAVLGVACSSSAKTTDPCSDTNSAQCATLIPAPTTPTTTPTTTSGSGTSGSTLDSFPPGTVSVDISQTAIGTVLVDGTGYTLYAFGTDTTGTPTCVDATCVATWKPLTGTGIAVATDAGASAGLFKLVARPDGTQQLAVGGRPVYRYTGDTKPGDTNGQGVGGQWHALTPDGTLISS